MLTATARRCLLSSGTRIRPTVTLPFGVVARDANPLALQRRGLSTTFGIDDNDTNNDEGEFLTGRVKFYNRSKTYGFVVPHDVKHRHLDVFLHRRDMVSDLPADRFPFNPMLIVDETIRFKLEFVQDEEGNMKPRARQITFTSGRPIPPLRRPFWKAAVERAQKKLGQDVYTIMMDTNEKQLSDEELSAEQWERIQGAWKNAQSSLDGAKAFIEKVGMEMEYFADPDGDKESQDDETEET